MTILIDNGHGKDTPGKCSPDKALLEWRWSREAAQMIAKQLQQHGFKVVLVVPEQQDISLAQRCIRVNRIVKESTDDCILLSIHNNAAGGDGRWHDAKGWSVFVSPNRSKRSEQLANCLLDAAKAADLMGNRWIPKEGYWVKNLAMCRETKCPAVLIENLFMDNKEDCRYLLSDAGKRAIVNATVLGVIKYISKQP